MLNPYQAPEDLKAEESKANSFFGWPGFYVTPLLAVYLYSIGLGIYMFSLNRSDGSYKVAIYSVLVVFVFVLRKWVWWVHVAINVLALVAVVLFFLTGKFKTTFTPLVFVGISSNIVCIFGLWLCRKKYFGITSR